MPHDTSVNFRGDTPEGEAALDKVLKMPTQDAKLARLAATPCEEANTFYAARSAPAKAAGAVVVRRSSRADVSTNAQIPHRAGGASI